MPASPLCEGESSLQENVRIKTSVTDACGIPATRYSIRLAWLTILNSVSTAVLHYGYKKKSGVLFKAVLRFGGMSYVTSGMDPTLLRCKTRKIMKADLFIKCF
jgi:hypothetical protein